MRLCFLLLAAASLWGQQVSPFSPPPFSSNPATCAKGQVILNTTNSNVQFCLATNIWSPAITGPSSSVIGRIPQWGGFNGDILTGGLNAVNSVPGANALVQTDTSTGYVNASLVAGIAGGWVNCKPFGCVGNGATDDTTAIENTIKSCPSSNTTNYTGSCHVYIPRGVYLISSTITWSQQGIILEGDTPGNGTSQGNVDRSLGTVLVACGTSTPTGCPGSFTGTELMRISMDDVNAFQSASNHGWMHGVSVRNMTLDLEYNTAKKGLVIYAPSNDPSFDNVVITGGTATHLWIAPTPSGSTSGSSNTHPEGVIFNNLLVYPGQKLLQGGCNTADLSAPAVELTAVQESQFRSGKVLHICAFNNSAQALLLIDGIVWTTGGNNVQLADGITIDGMSFGATNYYGIQVIGTDCTGGSCGVLGSAHYTQNNIFITHCIFEGFGTAVILGNESSGLTRTYTKQFYLKGDNDYRTPTNTVINPPRVFDADWVQGGELTAPGDVAITAPPILRTNAYQVLSVVEYDRQLYSETNLPIMSSAYNDLRVKRAYTPFSYLPPFMSDGATFPIASTSIYCVDCTTAAVCIGLGSGHWAVSNGSGWTCQ